MAKNVNPGDCVKLSDGRIARVRDVAKGTVRVRVRRKTSKTHQFLEVPGRELKKVACPQGWMRPAGYNRYLKVTLRKAKERARKAGR